MELLQFARVAEAAARQAGLILRNNAAALREVEFLDRNDVKLRADREAEVLIRAMLAKAFPNTPVIGEEQGGDAALLQQDIPFWVVDPLDGTYNFLRGAPQTCVSIGLMRADAPLLGIIYDFSSDTLFSGIVAHGFFINGTAHTPAWANSIDQAALVTGFPAGMDTSRPRMEAFIDTIAPFKKVRMLGTSALANAYVAAGFYDVYYEEAIRLWDVAAGLAMVQAVGGAIRMQPSQTAKPFAFDVWAGCPRFFN